MAPITLFFVSKILSLNPGLYNMLKDLIYIIPLRYLLIVIALDIIKY